MALLQDVFLHVQVAPSRISPVKESGISCHWPEALSGSLQFGLPHGPLRSLGAIHLQRKRGGGQGAVRA